MSPHLPLAQVGQEDVPGEVLGEDVPEEPVGRQDTIGVGEDDPVEGGAGGQLQHALDQGPHVALEARAEVSLVLVVVVLDDPDADTDVDLSRAGGLQKLWVAKCGVEEKVGGDRPLGVIAYCETKAQSR